MPIDPPRISTARAVLLAKIARHLDAIEAEMKRIDYWQVEPPAQLLERLKAGETLSFTGSGISFEQYLQLVFLPNARRRVSDDNLPASSNMGVIAMRQYDYHSYVEEAQPLLSLFRELDRLINGARR
jgi:uncharacterized protein YqcC (DUF446 family)